MEKQKSTLLSFGFSLNWRTVLGLRVPREASELCMELRGAGVVDINKGLSLEFTSQRTDYKYLNKEIILYSDRVIQKNMK